MPKFNIGCEWTMYGNYVVEAESQQDAIRKVECSEKPFDVLPDNGEYLDDSFEVDRDECYRLDDD